MNKPPKKSNRPPPTETTAVDGAMTPLTPDQRHEFISVAAFYLAECRGFEPGCYEDDWLAAEKEIDARYG